MWVFLCEWQETQVTSKQKEDAGKKKDAEDEIQLPAHKLLKPS